ncbi:MAG: IS4 family transposase [Mycobacterium sp.]
MAEESALLGTLDLGDARLEQRLRVLLETLAAHPGGTVPAATGAWAPTVAAYRFFANPHVEPGAVTAGLAAATVARCAAEPVVLAIQDTTSVDYTGHRQTTGLGPLEAPQRRGLFLHTTLAVSTQGVPLGVLDQASWARDPHTVGKRHQRHTLPIEAKESAKWLRAVQQTEARLGPSTAVVTVADREADIYEVFALAQTLHGDWLIRARHDRRVDSIAGKLRATIAGAPVTVTTTVDVPRQAARPARVATLEVRCGRVVLVPPRRATATLARWWAVHHDTPRLAPPALTPLRVGVLWVREVGAPAGERPVDWLLLTSLPLDTPAAVLTAVTYYRYRWLIERFHFVLKSGCRVERLQLATADRLQRALAVAAGVAWRLLWLTYEARARPAAPCTVVFDTATWQTLVVAQTQSVVLPTAPPDLHTAVRWIAQLGGFLGRTRDGEPGVETLWRGLTRLHDLVRMWHLLHPPSPPLPTEATCV